MLTILSSPVQSIAPLSFLWVLKFDPNQPRDVAGKWTTTGGLYPSQAEVDALEMAVFAKAGVKFPYNPTLKQRGVIKARIVKHLGSELSKAEGGLPEVATAETYVDQTMREWAFTSGDSNAPAVAAQRGIQEEFRLTDAAMDHFGVTSASTSVDRVYARVEYQATQAFLEEHGIEYVTLFRGVGGSIKKEGEQTVNMQPASSWTTDLDTAVEFAKARHDPAVQVPFPKAPTFAAGYGNVLVTRVPRSRVLSTAVTGRGALNEMEVLLLGGPIKVEAFALAKGDPAQRIRTRLQ